MQLALQRPEIDDRAEEPEAERGGPVDGKREREDQVQPVGWIEQSRLCAAEERRAGKDMGVPQREVAARELREAEAAPGEELLREVRALRSEHGRVRAD